MPIRRFWCSCVPTSDKVYFIVDALEESKNGRWYHLGPKCVVNLRTHIGSATLTDMAVSRVTRKHARIVHFADTLQQPMWMTSRPLDCFPIWYYNAESWFSDVVQKIKHNCGHPTPMLSLQLTLAALVLEWKYMPPAPPQIIAHNHMHNNWFFHCVMWASLFKPYINAILSWFQIFLRPSIVGASQQCVVH